LFDHGGARGRNVFLVTVIVAGTEGIISKEQVQGCCSLPVCEERVL